MRIAEAKVTPIAFRDPPLLNVGGVHQPFALRSIVEVTTDDGIVGLGESYGTSDILDALGRVAPALAGLPLHDTNAIIRRTAEVLGETPDSRAPYGPRRMANTYGAFEVAILDAQARHAGLPLHAHLGGAVRDGVPYSAYLFYKFARHADPSEPADDWGEVVRHDQMVGEAGRMVRDYGFTSLKLKAGVFEPEFEIETLRALRRAFPDHPLRIDPNAGWSVATTLRVLPSLEGLLEYLEDPTEPLEAMAEVARHAKMPLATNMVTTQFSHLPDTIRLGAVQVVLSDHHFWGGLRATQELAEICRIWGLGVSMHSNSHLGISLAAMTQVAATIPNLGYACDTHYPWQTEEVIAEGKLRFENGSLKLPSGPGLGVTLDRTALARLHRNYLDCGILTRDDGSEMRRHQPDWKGGRPRF
jgi:glucarate dehydratase